MIKIHRNKKGQFLKGYKNPFDKINGFKKGDANIAKRPEIKIKIKNALIGHEVSKTARKKMSDAKSGKRGEKTNHWKGDNIKYCAIHRWLNTTFGKADRCENNKTHKGKYQWALIKGKKYERRRKNFKKLCAKCHAKYDGRGIGRQRDKLGKFKN